MKLKGTFSIDNVRSNTTADIEFTYGGTSFHPPTDLTEQLNKAFGSTDWSCFEVFATVEDNGNIWQISDYGLSTHVMQYTGE